ncbi:MAG: leucyl aminopeptidase [Hyphomonadaceae bacterium]|nr:leucyl aminopeptidase [Hyphomonadaceae bacterium]MBC6412271.1 leucyl aminopeptidase [Hyphomonadaceae bacterium]
MRLTATLVLSSALALGATSAVAADMPEFRFNVTDLPERGDVVLFADNEGLSDLGEELDQILGGRLSTALHRHEFDGSFGKIASFHALAPFDTVTVIGMGDEMLTKRELHDLGGHAASQADGNATVIADGLHSRIAAPGAHIAKGFALRAYDFDKYKFKDVGTDMDDPQVVTLHVDDADAALRLFDNDLVHVVEGVYLARDLGTEPGNVIYPQTFIERVQPGFSGVSNVHITVLDEADMRRYGMGVLLGTARGSVHDGRMLIVNYTGGTPGDAPLALVGKGVTFDTGGISLKPNANMWYMKSDLSGAAAVAGTLLATAKRGENINVVGVMPLSENMPAADAIRPGDVLTSMGGKTVEIGSTDAEGRLQLIDAVQYTQQEHDPYMLLNIATLTGAAARAMGDDYGAVLTRDWALSLRMMKIGDLAGEDVWPLPLNDGHFEQIESDIADIVSTAGNPGASIGAAVVGTFVDEDLPWVHLDIAGVDWQDSAKPTIPKGHAGWGVRFMDELVRAEADK